MKGFLLKFVLFISLSLLLLSSGVIVINRIIARNATREIQRSSKYIILGHSHPECAFNDSLISGFSNFASSGESYFYTYFKLKNITERNRNIEAVFIEFSNNQ